jgi:hypothetical protein
MNAFIRCFACAAVVLTLGITSQSVVRNVRYEMTFGPVNQPHFYSGNMLLNFNQGTVSGTYNDTSVRPGGPMHNRRNVPVSGGLNAEGHATLLIGPLTFRGTLKGQTYSGTATWGSRVFTFNARQTTSGTPAP